jgi:hypothetical protein
MTGLISPHFSKLLAIALLLFVAWLAANISYVLISGRLRLASQIEEFRQRYEDIHKRRIDIPSLQNQLAELTSSGLLRSAAIAASSDSAASARLQQAARDGIDQVHGKLLSLNALGADRVSSSVAVQSSRSTGRAHARELDRPCRKRRASSVFGGAIGSGAAATRRASATA